MFPDQSLLLVWTDSSYGATYLLDQIGKVTGISDDLKTCFPDSYKKIESIAYFLILENDNPLSRFSKFSKTHKHPFDQDIPSQRSSEIFEAITEDQKMKFFRLQGNGDWKKSIGHMTVPPFLVIQSS